MKRTVVFDFDGVIHSYVSGWFGVSQIPDPPVEGIKTAIDKIRNAGYEVVVVSTRCTYPGGKEAIEKYLADNDIHVDRICEEKPPAICYIDDRAICFNGNASSLLHKINNFEPWMKKEFTNYDLIKDLSLEDMARFIFDIIDRNNLSILTTLRESNAISASLMRDIRERCILAIIKELCQEVDR